MRRPLVTVVVAVVAGACAAPADEERAGARPLTMAEAERLAQVRMRNHEFGGAHLTAAVPTAPGSADAKAGVREFALSADLNWRAHRGRGTLTVNGAPRPVPIAWTLTHLATRSPQGWRVRPLNRRGLQLDRILVAALSLAADRPENPGLLRRNQAAWLRSDHHAGAPVDVFRGPTRPSASSAPPDAAHTQYWVTGQGVLTRFATGSALGGPPAVLDLTGHGGRNAGVPKALLTASEPS